MVQIEILLFTISHFVTKSSTSVTSDFTPIGTPTNRSVDKLSSSSIVSMNNRNKLKPNRST